MVPVATITIKRCSRISEPCWRAVAELTAILRFIAAAEILDLSLKPAGRRFAGCDCRMRGRGRSIPLPLYTLQQRAPMQPWGCLYESKTLFACRGCDGVCMVSVGMIALLIIKILESGGNNARLRQLGLVCAGANLTRFQQLFENVLGSLTLHARSSAVR